MTDFFGRKKVVKTALVPIVQKRRNAGQYDIPAHCFASIELTIIPVDRVEFSNIFGVDFDSFFSLFTGSEKTAFQSRPKWQEFHAKAQVLSVYGFTFKIVQL